MDSRMSATCARNSEPNPFRWPSYHAKASARSASLQAQARSAAASAALAFNLVEDFAPRASATGIRSVKSFTAIQLFGLRSGQGNVRGVKTVPELLDQAEPLGGGELGDIQRSRGHEFNIENRTFEGNGGAVRPTKRA